MGLFCHRGNIDGDNITHFHPGHGSRCAVPAWGLRHAEPREVMVLRSDRGFADVSGDPGADSMQTLIYRGPERHVTVTDSGLTNDIAYYYSVFSKGDDGVWRLELTTTVALKAQAHWRRAGVGDDGGGPRKWAKLNFDIGTLSPDGLP